MLNVGHTLKDLVRIVNKKGQNCDCENMAFLVSQKKLAPLKLRTLQRYIN